MSMVKLDNKLANKLVHRSEPVIRNSVDLFISGTVPGVLHHRANQRESQG